VLEGPLGVGLGVGGLVAAGVGAVLLVTSGNDRAARTGLAPWIDRDARGLAWSTAF
jgi:hypothetical protein